ncbi:MAG: MOSC N-terminal beta barrel domain-containing protein [Pyrinomonadaceae bacterium]|nr:MOSC N-terminal beta barrel domain-containing protein [Pyrinomonadaceae bacterium]
MIQITGLFIYPIKSCRGISLQEVQLGTHGFLHDREFLVVDETDTFLTQRNTRELATIEVAIDPSGFVFVAASGELRLSFREIAARSEERVGGT